MSSNPNTVVYVCESSQVEGQDKGIAMTANRGIDSDGSEGTGDAVVSDSGQ